MEVALEQRDRAGETEITGRVSHLYYDSDAFSAGVLIADSGPLLDRDVKFSIKSRVQRDEQIILHGNWTRHPKFGPQFEASCISYPEPEATEEGLASYLANNPAFKGIGPAKAKLVAAECGCDFDRIIREEPHRIAQAAKLTEGVVAAIAAAWTEHADVNAISTWLAGFGLTHGQIKKIAERYGNRARAVLEDNPYVLCEEIHGWAFARTDEVAQKIGVPKDHPGRIRACLLDLLCKQADESGHTWILRSDLVKLAMAKLCLDSLQADGFIRCELQVLCDDNVPQVIAIEDETDGTVRIALRDLYRKEQDIINWLASGKKESLREDSEIEQAIASSVGSQPTDSQRAAIAMVLRSRVSIISGAAGTGKSFTIAAARRVFTNMGLEVAMCAPTGKAAKRMSQHAGGATAQTIHRLLEYSPFEGRFIYDADNQLPHSLVIVDEVSMCDIRLLWSLMSAIDFSKTQLLMVGDHNQLPPIGAGNTLRDALTNRTVPFHILDVCHRAAGALAQNCNKVLDGDVPKSTPTLPAGGREWWLIDNMEDPELVLESLRMLMREQFAKWGFHPANECQIITPQNKGPLGVIRINAEMQRIWQDAQGRKLPPVPAEEKAIRTRFYPGDKVMQTRNNYQLGVMNGTQGIVVDVTDGIGKDPGHIIIQFDDMPLPTAVEVGSDEAKDIVLAYAITCHKAQGSEWPCVVSIVHKQHTYMLSRNIVYTAVTRARKTSVVLGDKLGIRRAMGATAAAKRRTWMGMEQ
jgi:exodeoxyribonuclease V alpha subunit